MQNQADLVRALAVLAETAKRVGELIAACMPEPVKAEQPERFEHRDVDGDSVLVYPHEIPEFQSVLMVETDGDCVRLSQEAVNRLAQYLDRYRTDVACPLPLVGGTVDDDCAGMRGHDGPCSPDADDIGVAKGMA